MEIVRVLYVNTHYNGGGAEKIARQLFYGIKDFGIETFFLSGRNRRSEPKNINYIYKSLISRIPTYLIGKKTNGVINRTIYGKHKLIKFIKDNQIDIVHFHNMHGNYIGVNDLDEIKKVCPRIIITMHDMWLITGCCPHSMECNLWKIPSKCEGCRGSAALVKYVKKANQYLELKNRAFSDKNIEFVSPSAWLRNCALEGIFESENIRIINNGVDTSKYKNLSKDEMRRKYGLPRDKKILLFVSHSMESPYKGFKLLEDAISYLEDVEQYYLLILGHACDDFSIPIEKKCFGYIYDENALNEIYAAADLFIIPSIAENYPLVALESLASGTPVVCFRVGGLPEIVGEDVGSVVKNLDSISLAKKIEEICSDDKKLVEMSRKCREYAVNRLSIEKMFENYRKLYEEMMNKI